MANKAYIVANKQQEREVLDKLEREGMMWGIINEKPTDNKPSNWFKITIFPYVIFVDDVISWNFISRLEDEEIVFDGRKEEQMSDKYVVSQEFMNELMEWKSHLFIEEDYYIDQEAINSMPKIIKNWWLNDYVRVAECNKRLVSIIRYMNGANDFEVEKPKKWVVRSIGLTNDNEHYYVSIGEFLGLKRVINTFDLESATHFDTKEKAESWANSHQEVVEVEI